MLFRSGAVVSQADRDLGPYFARMLAEEPIERTPILPREIFSRFVNESFWMDPKNNISQVPVV